MTLDPASSTTAAAAEIFAQAARELVAAGNFHRLFDLRLVERQHALGLPIGRRTGFDEVDESLRAQLEASYLDACREVGALLAEAGRVREAWLYLRPTGEKRLLRDRLARTTPDEDAVDELIEVALFEGVDPERGFAWLAGRQGTCSAITTLDGMQGQLGPAELRACVAVLVRHVYGELRGNLRGHLQRLTGQAPPDLSDGELVEQFTQLTAAGDYHLDASHLASAVRHARVAADPEIVRKALEMAAYGSRLPADLQYPGDPPFEETYRAHGLFLAATLGEQVDAAREYFAEQARRLSTTPGDLAPVEAYVMLLDRIGDAGAALEAYAELVPTDAVLSPLAPTLVELAARSGAWEQFEAICRTRSDVVALAAGRIIRQCSHAPTRGGILD